jgi:hypothetical protein
VTFHENAVDQSSQHDEKATKGTHLKDEGYDSVELGFALLVHKTSPSR